jgi:hypothetical protein
MTLVANMTWVFSPNLALRVCARVTTSNVHAAMVSPSVGSNFPLDCAF